MTMYNKPLRVYAVRVHGGYWYDDGWGGAFADEISIALLYSKGSADAVLRDYEAAIEDGDIELSDDMESPQVIAFDLVEVPDVEKP